MVEGLVEGDPAFFAETHGFESVFQPSTAGESTMGDFPLMSQLRIDLMV